MVHCRSSQRFFTTSNSLFGGLYGGLGAAIGSTLFRSFCGHTPNTLYSLSLIKVFRYHRRWYDSWLLASIYQ